MVCTLNECPGNGVQISNRLNSVSSSVNGGAATVRNFTYDQAGNPLTGVYNSLSTTLDYNDANRQEQMYIGSKPQVTLHNALGQRTSKAVMDKGINRVEHYHYDQSGQLIAVTNAAGAVLSEHVFLDGMPIAANLLTDTPLGVTLVSNDKIPNAGDAVVYTGIPQGGNGKIFEYRFRIKDTTGTWTTVRDWSGSDSYSWSVPTTLGSYSVEVTARNQGSTASITTAATVNVVAPLAQTTKLSSSQLAPGASYTLTTTSTGGMLATAYQHRVRIKGPSTNNQYVVLRDWNSNNTYAAAMPTPLGAYTFEVCVLQYGTNANLACIYQGVTVTTTPVTTLASQSASTKQVGTGWTLSTASNAGTPVLEWFVVHTDQLGTARALTNSAGKMVWRWFTQPFGEGAANTDVDGDGRSVTFNLRFPGQYFDWDTRLHYNYFRNYDVSTGRYIESDPIGLMGGSNTYTYVKGNPLSYIDPLGLVEIPSPNSIPGGPWEPHPSPTRPGQFLGPKDPSGKGGRMQCQYVPPEGQGGTPGSKGYFKTNGPGQIGWQRYDLNGNPLTVEQAHRVPTPKIPTSPFFFIPNIILLPLQYQMSQQDCDCGA